MSIMVNVFKGLVTAAIAGFGAFVLPVLLLPLVHWGRYQMTMGPSGGALFNYYAANLLAGLIIAAFFIVPTLILGIRGSRTGSALGAMAGAVVALSVRGVWTWRISQFYLVSDLVLGVLSASILFLTWLAFTPGGKKDPVRRPQPGYEPVWSPHPGYQPVGSPQPPQPGQQ